MKILTYDKNSMGICYKDVLGNNPFGKINIERNFSVHTHRSGWNFVLESLKDFHNKNGVGFYGFLEDTFFWSKNYLLEKKILPIKKDWIGVFHNPPNMPSWWSPFSGSFSSILIDPIFHESLKSCKGIFTLSDYHKDYLSFELPKNLKIESILHPTEEVECNFEFVKFLENDEKKIVNLGWWLRKQYSFYKLKVSDRFKKLKVLPNNDAYFVLDRINRIESIIYNIVYEENDIYSVQHIRNLSNEEYDDLLSKNIVFLDLYDSSANNSIIECIIRGTPILVNRLPAVEEYLGPKYPFYFNGYDEVYKKTLDFDLIEYTSKYLKSISNKIKSEKFISDFKNSKIYNQL